MTTITHEQCTGCDREDIETWEEFFYFSPWDDEETSTGCYYCQECNDSGYDEGYFHCEWCERDILDTNRNGHMYQYRVLNDCEMVCLRCTEEVLKDKGLAGLPDELEALRVGDKMFAQFFNVGELESEGWTADPDYHNRCLALDDVLKLGKRAWEHHEAGYLVIVEIESMSILGDEGYLTLRTKKKEEQS